MLSKGVSRLSVVWERWTKTDGHRHSKVCVPFENQSIMLPFQGALSFPFLMLKDQSFQSLHNAKNNQKDEHFLANHSLLKKQHLPSASSSSERLTKKATNLINNSDDCKTNNHCGVNQLGGSFYNGKPLPFFVR